MLDDLCRLARADIVASALDDAELHVWQGLLQVAADNLCVDDVVCISPECMHLHIRAPETRKQLPLIKDWRVPKARQVCITSVVHSRKKVSLMEEKVL